MGRASKVNERTHLSKNLEMAWSSQVPTCRASASQFCQMQTGKHRTLGSLDGADMALLKGLSIFRDSEMSGKTMGKFSVIRKPVFMVQKSLGEATIQENPDSM